MIFTCEKAGKLCFDFIFVDVCDIKVSNSITSLNVWIQFTYDNLYYVAKKKEKSLSWQTFAEVAKIICKILIQRIFIFCFSFQKHKVTV